MSALLVLAVSGCGKGPADTPTGVPSPHVLPPPVAPAPKPKPAPAVPKTTGALDLNAVPLDEALPLISKATGQPVVVVPNAKANAHCARVTLAAPEGTAIVLVRAKLANAIASSGLRLETSSVLFVSMRPDARIADATCEMHEPPKADPSSLDDLAWKNRQAVDSEKIRFIREGITLRSEGNYDVTEAALSVLSESQEIMMMQARILPSYAADGTSTGITLYGVRQDSLLAHMGIRNGDAIRDMNGFDLATPEKAFEGYAGLKTAETVTLHGERDGKPLTLTYHIGGRAKKPVDEMR
ncbi:MAG: hypothetical protein R3A78_15675 [Polyangiales bacterium]|nr:hypothetical protein [Myxococcales bacterium]